MPITDLIPWKKEETAVAVRRQKGEDAFIDLRSRMNRLFDEFFERPFGLSPFSEVFTLTGDFAPRIDLSEDDREITLTVELPGIEPDGIDIALDRNVLTISGEKRAEKEERGRRYHRIERTYGSFYRSIPLPDEVDEDRIAATFKHGVLKIRLPKTVEAQSKSRRIPVKTG